MEKPRLIQIPSNDFTVRVEISQDNHHEQVVAFAIPMHYRYDIPLEEVARQIKTFLEQWKND